MASPADASTAEFRDREGHDWPGERNPTQWDVHDAQQVPEVSFQHRFKAALLLSEDAIGGHHYLTSNMKASSTRAGTGVAEIDHGSTRQFTYPMAILSQLPLLPEGDTLCEAQAKFNTSFKRHLFLSALTFPPPFSINIVPPYLKIGLACLGDVASQKVPVSEQLQDVAAANNLAADLFVAGDGFWGVMMEVDNREARLFESVLAGCLYATYGILSADEEFWDMSSSTVAGTATMARRLRMHCEEPSPASHQVFLEHNPSTCSLLMSYLFLADVIRAVHCGRIACISTKELFMRMPSSSHNFQQMYSCLFSGTRTIPSDLRTDEDSLLLLTGICADILFSQHTFSKAAVSVGQENVGGHSAVNPYAPLSPSAEALRQHFLLNAALDRWLQHFGDIASKDVLSMFYFCRLIQALPDISRLPSLAGYPPNSRRASTRHSDPDSFEVSNQAANFAWLILDNSSAQTGGSDTNVSVWLPVVLFFAALTIWHHLRHQSSSSLRTGTLRTLKMFKDELNHLPWPCCVEMCRTLDRLASQPTHRSPLKDPQGGGRY